MNLLLLAAIGGYKRHMDQRLCYTDSNVPSQTQSVVEEEDDEEQDEDQNIPDLTGFVIEDMKQRYDSVINRLYTGIQCYSCGMRFTTSQTDIYADHLDWHYRQNRSEKDISKKVTHRRWYYSLTDWIEFEEIAELEERAKSQFFEKVHEEVVQKTQEAAKEKEFQSVKAAADVVDETCEICQEQFEMYWEEDEEEWHLKDAIRVDEKTYHPSCYEDYKNLKNNFNDRFQDFHVPKEVVMFARNPFTVSPESDFASTAKQFLSSVEEGPLQLELVDIQASSSLKDLQNDGAVKFWTEHIQQVEFPNARKLAVLLLIMFGSTYTCESSFSHMNVIKSNTCSSLTNERLQHCL
ncbi:UNVERIFIED_CONTAM: hypothetical protein FKN15_044480 [Acipenser sinensis]